MRRHLFVDRAEAATVCAALMTWLVARKCDPNRRNDPEDMIATAGDELPSLDEAGCRALVARVARESAIPLFGKEFDL